MRCEWCGDPLTFNGKPGVPPSLANRKKFCSRRCAALGRPVTGTSKIADAAIDLWASTWDGEPYEKEKRVRRWSIDLALPHSKHAIELDGVYWHSLPEMVEKDRRKDAALKRRGWTVSRIVIEKDSTPEELAALIDAAITKERRHGTTETLVLF